MACPICRQAFSDGIYWLSVGQKPNLLDLQNQILRQLAGSKETFITTEQEAKEVLVGLGADEHRVGPSYRRATH
jgi:hypothetical protein